MSREGARRVSMSLGTKLAVTTVGVLVAVSALLFLQLTSRERETLIHGKQTAVTMVTDQFAEGLSAPLDFADEDAVQDELKNLRTNPDLRCAWVFLGDADDPTATLGGADCTGGHAPKPDEMGARVFDDRIEVARPVMGQAGTKVGAAKLVFSLAPENAAFSSTRQRIFWLSFALAAGTAVLLLAIARFGIVRPLHQLREGARRVEKGDLGSRVEVASNDEIGELADAFNAMREAIADREQRLEAATQNLRDLFDHMRQAILAFDAEGNVRGAVSRRARRLFGDELEGLPVRVLLYPDVPRDPEASANMQAVDAQAFDEWLSMAFQIDPANWQEFAELAPKEVTLPRSGQPPIPLELEFRPVTKKGRVDRVMLLATDVSEQRRLQATVASQEEEYALRLAAMRRLVAGGGHVFVSFIDAARDRLARCKELVGPAPRTIPTAEIDELFRHVHTIKGEARAFDLRELEIESAKLEEELDELRARARGEGFVTTGSIHHGLLDRLGRIAEAIDNGCEVFVEASPIGRLALDQISVQRADLASVVDAVRAHPEWGDALGKSVSRLAARPFGESTASLVDAAPTWAEKEGKLARMDVEGREVRIPPELARLLSPVLTHLVRNAIAHGIEPKAVREEQGKPSTGVIRVVAVEGARGPVITVEDDGRGLDLRGIEARAGALGLVPIAGNVAELVFKSGVSTAGPKSGLAGRGVGLTAVRADLERVGYIVELESQPGRFTRVALKPGERRHSSRPPRAQSASPSK
jgi:HAMP domain-containing protein/HPt (histidine-containing phosphotransfer) domain-containing protein